MFEKRLKPLASEITPESTGLSSRLKQGLQRTRHQLADGLATVILGKKTIDAKMLEDIETRLLTADVGVEATQHIIRDLTARISRKQLNDTEALFQALKNELVHILQPAEHLLVIPASDRPYMIMMIGINGAGKTTTIGKLAKLLQQSGKKVMFAAGDTFRAAAVEQLQVWGERNNIPVIAQHTGADGASVIYDALQAAQARQFDALIADTAGRLHTKDNLMEELKKVKRVMAKLDPTAPHEIMLVLDACIGQNAMNQVHTFHDAIGVTSLVLTKLDGTAKGGVIFAIAEKTKLPIRYIGIGEAIDDLKPFHAEEFVQALFSHQKIMK